MGGETTTMEPFDFIVVGGKFGWPPLFQHISNMTKVERQETQLPVVWQKIPKFESWSLKPVLGQKPSQNQA
jgi:hypothetical protein